MRVRRLESLNIVSVSMGTPEQAEAFRVQMHSPHRFIADPHRALYKHFGLKRATNRQVFNLRVMFRGLLATLRGLFMGKPVGDPMQLQGVFKIETDGRVSWEHRAVDVSDNVSAETIEGLLRP